MTTITSADLDILRARMAAAIGGRMALRASSASAGAWDSWPGGSAGGCRRCWPAPLVSPPDWRAQAPASALESGSVTASGLAFSPAGPTGATLVPAFRHAFLTAAAIAAITTPIARTIWDAGDAAATMRPREQNPAAPPPPAAVPPQIQEGTLDLGQSERPRAGAADGPGRIIQPKAAAHPISWACASGPWP